VFKISSSDKHSVILPDGHRFPMLKYELIKEQLLYEGIIRKEQIFYPDFIDEAIITLTHMPAYWFRVQNLLLSAQEVRKIGFPQTESLVLRSHSSASGTFYCALNALRDKIGMNIAGGTHHAYADRGEGYCVLNDVAISVQYLLSQSMIKQALIIDLDVHQGNGTAKIFERNDQVFTYSVHCAANYPLKKEQSDLDEHLPANMSDDAYLALIAHQIPLLLDSLKPDIVYYISGVDILSTDLLGKLNISLQGCYERDKLVLSNVYQRDIPLVVVMGGGYSRKMNDIVSAHVATFKLAQYYYD
jgi:acetoin utilization deacetylase AcuC-like enzyme